MSLKSEVITVGRLEILLKWISWAPLWETLIWWWESILQITSQVWLKVKWSLDPISQARAMVLIPVKSFDNTVNNCCHLQRRHKRIIISKFRFTYTSLNYILEVTSTSYFMSISLWENKIKKQNKTNKKQNHQSRSANAANSFNRPHIYNIQKH